MSLLIKYLLALFGALAIILVTYLSMPKEMQQSGFLISEATWHPNPAMDPNILSRPIRVGSSLHLRNADLHDCCNGTYEIILSRVDIARSISNGDMNLGLYIPAIGGDFSVKINNSEVQIPAGNYSTIGPLLTLGSLKSLPEISTVTIQVRAKNSGFTGMWRNTAVIDSFYRLQKYRDSDLIHQKIIPGIVSLLLFICAGLFLYIYFVTKRSFSVYLIFSACLLLSGIFDLFLGGYIRDMSLVLGAKWHYFAKVLASYGQSILVISFLTFAKETKFTQFHWKLFKSITFLFTGISLFVAIATEVLGPVPAARAACVAMPLAYIPLIWWSLKNGKIRSFHFLAFTVALASFFGSISDAIKLGGRTFNLDIPVGYFDRYTTPLFLSLSLLVYIRHLTNYFNEYQVQVQATAKEAAIARTIQSLAHDVRRPFSLLKIGMQMLRRVKDMSHLQKVLQQLAPEVDKSISSVQGMLDDILEAGSNSKVALESISLSKLLESTLTDISNIRKGSDVSLNYKLRHTKLLFVDIGRTQRVFLNLIDNAFQAMKLKGSITFASSEVVKNQAEFVEVSITNSNSFIPPEIIAELFEAFFTHGKKGGTGLGLFIAKKVVEAHGGSIWCASSKEGGTTFTFQLPCEKESVDNTHMVLRENSKAFEAPGFDMISESQAQRQSFESKETENQLVTAILNSKSGLESIKILVIDDETIYADGLKSEISQIEAFKDLVQIETVSVEREALLLIEHKKYQLLICDIDLGFDGVNGIDLVRIFRRTHPQAMICVHSNRMISQYSKAAIEAGADVCLPKPMTRVHLLQLINSSH